MIKSRPAGLALMIFALFLGLACSNQRSMSYKDSVKAALEQADLKDLSVTEDKDKNTITLGGTLHSEDAKAKAAEVAKSSAGDRIVVNEISVQPLGVESEAKSIASNVDDGIEKNYKAVLISNRLDKQHIRFDSKNAVLTLTGKVKSPADRKEAEQLAQTVPNVQQVVNKLDVQR